MKHRSITDPILGVSIILGVGDGRAQILWADGMCFVDEAALCTGEWKPVVFPDVDEKTPPAAVICRATAFAVSAWIKEGFERLWKGLP